MITGHLHPVEPEMIRILYLKNFLSMTVILLKHYTIKYLN